MDSKTIDSELITEEELVEIANDLGGDHGKFISDLYDFGDMWLLCDIVVEYVDKLSERTSETAGREKSDLMRVVSGTTAWTKCYNELPPRDVEVDICDVFGELVYGVKYSGQSFVDRARFVDEHVNDYEAKYWKHKAIKPDEYR